MLKLSPEEFNTLDHEIRDLLLARGFANGRRERDGPFGSHFSEYSRGGDRVTISYDGRDNAIWFTYAGGPDAATASEHLRQPLSLKFSGKLASIARRIRERIQHAI